MEVITAILKFLYEFVYNQALDLCGNKLLHCRQQLATDPYSVLLQVWLNFTAKEHGGNPLLGCLQTNAIWQALLCHMKCYQKLPQYLGKLQCNFLFSTASCICVITWCIVVSVDLLVFRPIGIDIWDIPRDSPLIFLVTNFCIIYCMKNSTQIGLYPLGLAYFVFLGTGVDVI